MKAAKCPCFCTSARRSAGILSAYYDRELKSAGITLAQYSLLVALEKLGSVNITHWAQQVGLERSTMVRNVKLLEENGLIELTQGTGKTFTLSRKGKTTVLTATPLWEHAQKKVKSCLGKEDAKAFISISEKLLVLREAEW